MRSPMTAPPGGSCGSPAEDRDGGGRFVAVVENPAAVLCEGRPGPRDLTAPAAAAQLVGQFDELGAAGGAERMAPGQQAAADVDRDTSAELGGAAADELRGIAGLGEAHFLVEPEFRGRAGVVDFGDVDVVGFQAGLDEGGTGRP